MSGSIHEGFAALVDTSDDEILKAHLQERVNALFAKKREEHEYAEAFLAIEKEILLSAGGSLDEQDIRYKVSRSFAGTEKEYPNFSVLFLSDEMQFLQVINELIVAYAGEWRLFFGKGATEKAVATSLVGTPWEGLTVSASNGIVYDLVRLRSVEKCCEIAFSLFEHWHDVSRLMFGREAAKRSFERAYRRVAARYTFLSILPKLLGAMPLEVLADEKAKHIRELETTTVSQARSIRSADADLRRQAERLQQTVSELSETKEKLVETSRARSEFIAVVSHQFRTPLSSIRWNSELLTDAVAEGKLNEEFAEAVEAMRIKSVYLVDTLDRIFTTLDIETGELRLDIKNAFLWEVAQEVYRQYERDIARRGLKWSFKRRKEQVRGIPMDKDKIVMVLRILISNAILYNKDGGTIDVDVDTIKRNGNTYQIFSIRDEGIGIPEEDQQKIFEKFYRSKPSVLKVADGTGLGMYVVKHIIEAHRGEVLVESRGENKGTTASFTLPIPEKK